MRTHSDSCIIIVGKLSFMLHREQWQHTGILCN